LIRVHPVIQPHIAIELFGKDKDAHGF
jgi:hypothetical protein